MTTYPDSISTSITEASPAVFVQKVGFRYRSFDEDSDTPADKSASTEAQAIEDISFSLPKGELMLIAGPSGCGKSTLLKCLNGLIPHSYPGTLSGEIQLEGRSIRGLSLRDLAFYPKPIQQPRIPIWVVGAWPSQKSMRRVLRYDGLLPTKITGGDASAAIMPEDIRAMKAYIDEHRSQAIPFDIVQEGETPGEDSERAREIVRPYAEAGATWWTESRWSFPPIEELRRRIQQGPPRIE